MKKGLYCLCIFGAALSVKAQIDIPFNLVTLVKHTHSQIPKDSILPSYQNGGFVYINLKDGQPVFNKRFREAYPFNGKYALVFDTETKSYNLIDRTGSFIIDKGIYTKINHRTTCGTNFISFLMNENSTEYNFNRLNGKFELCSGTSCGYPVLLKFPFRKNEGGQYTMNTNSFEVENATPLDDNYFMVLKEGKIGIIDRPGKILVPIEYEESSINFIPNRINVINILPLKKDNVWYYYNTKGELITKSPWLCQTLLYGQTKLGIYQNGQKYGLLYTDGTTLQKEYDWISEDGLLARTGNDFYFILDKRIVPYYVK
ncbi:WG repeat-containing protein [Chryseobacterium capnotolerans]|uniref:WG repeat-containing protein n=1 Tax=Chryseobacterium TaxID=59732 RepID=UPI00083B2214|nr:MULTISPECIES: WG repeat-containing protein [Chryseobacterium]UHO39962.1 WG repeat-containing protein [Chryseobacterium capnotolerans]